MTNYNTVVYYSPPLVVSNPTPTGIENDRKYETPLNSQQIERQMDGKLLNFSGQVYKGAGGGWVQAKGPEAGQGAGEFLLNELEKEAQEYSAELDKGYKSARDGVSQISLNIPKIATKPS